MKATTGTLDNAGFSFLDYDYLRLYSASICKCDIVFIPRGLLSLVQYVAARLFVGAVNKKKPAADLYCFHSRLLSASGMRSERAGNVCMLPVIEFTSAPPATAFTTS